MEFKFNVNDIFKKPIIEINNNLVPPGFSGDRRALWDTLGKVSEIVNTMGEASAAAQGLSKPITTAERLRNSEHKLYFLIDHTANNGKGAVTGMLKTGNKGLYVFDRHGQHYQVTPQCILDFYIHESRQRTGLGKQLFEHMLQKEEVDPVKMAIDRPSEKLLGFLNKHYSLNSPVKQMNNYVVFDGFFPKSEQSHVTESRQSDNLGRKESANGLQKFSSPQGRYGAPRPPCSMGQIIHNQTTHNKNQEPMGVPATNYQGVYHEGSYPTSQSTPNMCMGQRILNNQNLEHFKSANINHIQNDNSQTVCNSQNLQNLATSNQDGHHSHIPMETIYNYQQYTNNSNLQPFIDMTQNQNAMPQPQCNSAQNMFNQYPLSNNLQNTLYTNGNNSTNYQNLTQSNQRYIAINPKAEIQSYMQLPTQYNNLQNVQQTSDKSEAPQNVNNQSGSVGSQVYINIPHQNQQGIISPHQHYPNGNQQFKNLNLNNQISSLSTATNNIPTQLSSNTQYLNVPAEADEVYQNQTVMSSVASNPNKINNLANLSQTSTYNNAMSNNYIENVGTRENLQDSSNNMETSQQEIQDITITEKNSQLHQNIIEPHLHSNQYIKLNNFPVDQLSQIPQVNTNMNHLHSYPQHSISHPQILSLQSHEHSNMPHRHTYRNTFNHMLPQSVTSYPLRPEAVGHQIQNGPLQQPYNAPNGPVTYNQTYGNLNVSPTKEQLQYYSPDKKYLQDTPVIQIAKPICSDKNVSDVSNLQMSRHNIVNESSSAPNMTNNVNKKNNKYVSKLIGDNTQVEEKSDCASQDQEVNQNTSQGDRPVYEEEYLSYGYPPQFTKSQILTRSNNTISIRHPY